MTNKEKLQELLANGTLEILLKLFIKKIGKDALDGRTGGYFSIRHLDDHNTVISKKVGEIDPEKKEKYQFLSSTEKTLRLKRYLSSGHLTSYESRSPEAEILVKSGRIEKWGMWGGAVYISKYFIFSFSGFPEIVDEAFVCFLGLKSGLLSREQFNKIKRRRGDNPYLKLL